jgi:6-phosphogluconolactonase
MGNTINFYVASCVPDGGVYRCKFDIDGKVETKKVISAPSPMWIEPAGDESLWVLMRAPFEDSPNSGVAKFSLIDGERIGDVLSTEGAVACHLAVDGDNLYAANYISGNVWSSGGKLVTHSGKGMDPVRQTSPHVHSVFFSPDKKYILSCDLGIDKIFVYDRKLNFVSSADAPAGAGARHLAFSKDGDFVYVINEMGGSISIFSYTCGLLDYVNTVSVLPSNFSGVGSGAAIKLSRDGTRLYVTERSTQSIITLAVKDDNLQILARTDCNGKEPRDFTLLADDRFAVCTNQFDNTIALFCISPEGVPSFLNKVELAAPLCAIENRN